MIHIWGKPACPSCTKAKAICEKYNYPFEYRELGKDFDREEVLTEFPEARTFPQIVVNGLKVGGYEQFVKYIEDTGYNGTGYTL
jgi:glutaredoxin 3